MKSAYSGVRVLRGPDWDKGDVDGGEGHLGTITEFDSNQMVRVLWDNGAECTCKAGTDGKYELRIFDTAQVGVRHAKKCCECCTENLYGMLWQCKDCDQWYLCSECYFADKHDLRHRFLRIDTYTSDGQEVPKRLTSVKMRAMGLFPGAKVTRGKDWVWGDQDGGAGAEGEIESFENVAPTSIRNMVRVRWSNGNCNSYRQGYEGYMDLLCAEEEVGSYYYRDHLPVLDILKLDVPLAPPDITSSSGVCTSAACSASSSSESAKGTSQTSIADTDVLSSSPTALSSSTTSSSLTLSSQSSHSGTSQEKQAVDNPSRSSPYSCDDSSQKNASVEQGELSETELPGGEASCGIITEGETPLVNVEDPSPFAVGDTVMIGVDEENLRVLQTNFNGTSEGMINQIGQTGEVIALPSNDCLALKVKFNLNQEYMLNPLVVVKVTSVKEGDVVRIRRSVDQVRLLNRRVGWTVEMAAACGKVGKVLKVDAAGDVTVTFGNLSFRFAPVCCLHAPNSPLDTLGKKRTAVKNTTLAGGENNDEKTTTVGMEADSSRTGIGNLLTRLFRDAGGMGRMSGSEDGKSQIADPQTKELFQAIANGEEQTVERLLTANKSLLTAEYKTLTPLMYACYKGKGHMMKTLLHLGADINAPNSKGSTAIISALEGQEDDIAVQLLDLGADPTVICSRGQTALHAAARNNMVQTLQVLVCMGVDVNAKDKYGDTALFDAINLGRNDATEILLRAPELNCKIVNRSGFNILHLACLKDRPKAVEIILEREQHPHVDDKMGGQYTALHIAANNDHVECIGLLVLLGGAKIDLEDGKQYLTPLHLACKRRMVKAAETLLELGAKVNVTDKHGNTPLHLAMGKNIDSDDEDTTCRRQKVIDQRSQLAKLLISNGANVDAKDDTNKSPLSYGFAEVQTAVREFLKQNKPVQQSANVTTGNNFALGQRTNDARSVVKETTTSKQDNTNTALTDNLQCHFCKADCDVTFQPCGHKTVCHKCSDAITRCPLCDVIIEEKEEDNKDDDNTE